MADQYLEGARGLVAYVVVVVEGNYCSQAVDMLGASWVADR